MFCLQRARGKAPSKEKAETLEDVRVSALPERVVDFAIDNLGLIVWVVNCKQLIQINSCMRNESIFSQPWHTDSRVSLIMSLNEDCRSSGDKCSPVRM